MHADVPAGGEHVQGCSLMVTIWARNLSWNLIGMCRGMGAGTLSVTWRPRCHYPAGESADISRGFVSF